MVVRQYYAYKESSYILDVSLSRWGAFCDGKVVYRKWPTREKPCHINCLELLAALNELKSFVTELTRCEIFLSTDNSSANAYISKRGATKYQQLNIVKYPMFGPGASTGGFTKKKKNNIRRVLMDMSSRFQKE